MALTQKEISQLYVALLNRAADAGGVEYWIDAEKPLAETAQEMINSQAGTSFYPEDNRDFIEQIYTNTVGLEGQEEAALQYWVDQLASGMTRGELVTHMVNSIMDSEYEGTPYQESFVSRVAVSEYVARLNLAGMSPEELVAATTFDEDGLGVVRTEADTTSAKEKAGELEAVDNTSLTEALAELADAKEAQVDFLKGLELDVNGDSKYDSADHAEGKATEGNVNTVFSAAATAIAGATGTTLANTDYEDLTKQALQDVDMTTAKTAAQGNVNVATAAAKNGMTALIEAADQALEDYNAAVEVYDAAATALTIEVGAFQAANSTITVATGVVYASAYSPTTDYTGKIIISNGKAYTGQDGTGASGPVALADLVEDATVKRVTELEAANNTKVAAEATAGNQYEALVDAVGAIYVSEAGGHSLKDIGSAVTTLASPPVAIASYSLTDSALEIHKTAADAAAFGVKQVITITKGAETAGGKITLDSVEVTLAKDDTPAQVATKIAEAFQSSTKWDVTANGADVTFAGAEAGNTPLAAATDFADTGTTGTTVTVAANSITAATLASGAANADALKTALSNLDALEKAIANFEAARDIKVELEALKKAAVDAGKAITDSVEDGGLGVTLREGDQNFTTSDDVYLFDANKTTATILSNFGAKGEDKIFFGDSFTGGLVGIEATKDDNGDVSAHEIFWLQSGNDTILYVEQKSFAGNGTGAGDMVEITLTGVKGEDLSFEDGFLTIA